MAKAIARKLVGKLRLYTFCIGNFAGRKFTCPVCGFRGPFRDLHFPTGKRRYAQCPKCGALERHRLQYLVLTGLLQDLNSSALKMIHFAPEPFFQELFSRRFGQYVTADPIMGGVDYHLDLQQLPFADESYDFIFASHVLEHVPDDGRALSEIRRILKPGGMAILPVPLVAEKTIEYPEPNPNESGHVRAPGFDYFERYSTYFPRVDEFNSNSFPSKYQLYVYEDRSGWPTKECPLRPAMKGERHIDVVPVCHV